MQRRDFLKRAMIGAACLALPFGRKATGVLCKTQTFKESANGSTLRADCLPEFWAKESLKVFEEQADFAPHVLYKAGWNKHVKNTNLSCRLGDIIMVDDVCYTVIDIGKDDTFLLDRPLEKSITRNSKTIKFAHCSMWYDEKAKGTHITLDLIGPHVIDPDFQAVLLN